MFNISEIICIKEAVQENFKRYREKFHGTDKDTILEFEDIIAKCDETIEENHNRFKAFQEIAKHRV